MHNRATVESDLGPDGKGKGFSMTNFFKGVFVLIALMALIQSKVEVHASNSPRSLYSVNNH